MIHREGRNIILSTAAVIAVILYLSARLLPGWYSIPPGILLAGFLIFLMRFFRDPGRKPETRSGRIYAPADGRVVVIENTVEEEYLKEERIQVSIFMSIWNVHINWFPAGGIISYVQYHPGRYLVARHPKSSLLNERNSICIAMDDGRRILVRQIAGAVARRIIGYARQGDRIEAGDEMGFIRFGSRVDVFLPTDAKILVRQNERCRGGRTVLAELK